MYSKKGVLKVKKRNTKKLKISIIQYLNRFRCTRISILFTKKFRDFFYQQLPAYSLVIYLMFVERT